MHLFRNDALSQNAKAGVLTKRAARDIARRLGEQGLHPVDISAVLEALKLKLATLGNTSCSHESVRCGSNLIRPASTDARKPL